MCVRVCTNFSRRARFLFPFSLSLSFFFFLLLTVHGINMPKMRFYTTLLSLHRGISSSAAHPLGNLKRSPSCGTVKSITHFVSTTLVNKPPVSSSALGYSSSSSCSSHYRNYTSTRFYSMTTQPRLLTVGVGAVGAIYSWRLSKSCNVTAVCRSNYEAVKKDGFDIDSAKFGKDVFRPDQVARTVSECVTAEPFDYILVTLKALPECYNVADIIAPAVSKDTTIVLIQNGLGVEEPITERFPDNPIVSIVAYIGTSQMEPGKIKMVGKESLVVGKYLGAKRDSDKQRAEFIELLKKGDCDVQIVEDVEKVRWQKLFWNAAFSPVCAMTGMNTTELLANQEAMSVVKKVMGEVIDASIANGYQFNHDEQMHAMISRTEATATNYKPSMQLDKERNSPMEIEVILGTPLRRAKAKGLSVPNLELIHSLCSATNALIMQQQSKKSQL